MWMKALLFALLGLFALWALNFGASVWFVERHVGQYAAAARLAEVLSVTGELRQRLSQFHAEHGRFPHSLVELGEAYLRPLPPLQAIELAPGGILRVRLPADLGPEGRLVLSPRVLAEGAYGPIPGWDCQIIGVDAGVTRRNPLGDCRAVDKEEPLAQAMTPPAPDKASLRRAIREGRDTQAIDLIQRGVPTLADTPAGESHPLWLAIEHGRPAVVKALLDAGPKAKLLRPDESAVTLLMHAAQKRRNGQAILEQLIAVGVPVDARDRNGLTALMYAARAGDAQAARTLLAAGADVLATDDLSRRPLDIALSAPGGSPAVSVLMDAERKRRDFVYRLPQ